MKAIDGWSSRLFIALADGAESQLEEFQINGSECLFVGGGPALADGLGVTEDGGGIRLELLI